MVITVFGLGFVGLTTALGFCEYGHTVYGIEINKERLDTIKNSKLPFLESGLDNALTRHLNKRFHPIAASGLAEAVNKSGCVYYCVGTPYGKDGQADLTYLFNAIDETLEHIHDNQFRVLVVKSTIPPSTTENKIIPHVKARGVSIGAEGENSDSLHVGIANNPEFLREGHCWDDFMNADRIVLGVSDKQTEIILRQIYATVKAPIFCVSLNTGEFIKYLSNTLLATLISYSNEMSVIADTIGGIDVSEAFRILHLDKRWGGCNMSSYVYPGCGYGGYCLPKDTNALYAVTKTAGFDAQILKNVISTNDEMPAFITHRIIHAIGDNTNIKIGILGLSFKPGSDDVRDTPSAKIINQLIKVGYKDITGYDPVAIDEFRRYYPNINIKYNNSYKDLIVASDALVITTAWPEFKNIRELTEKPLIDCRYML
jgi:UDPglucose 6-dehydrogenase